MLRVLGSSFGLALVAAMLTHGSMVAFWAVFVLVLAANCLPLLAGESALKCPSCRKRIKLRAPSCHHCGRTVSAAS